MAVRLAFLLSVVANAACCLAQHKVHVNFNNVTQVSRIITTLQVVSNPILDREFTAPNGTKFANPIHKQAWASLSNLEADLVRYVPWYPYPWKSVAELKQGVWNFTYIMPMLEDFMDAVYGRNHSVVMNFATQPCWLFGQPGGKQQDCSYPANPDQSFFGYVRGNRQDLLDPSAGDLAAYYARLLSYFVKGEFTDEHGVRHTGGPKYSNFNRDHGHVWELFNEGEHGYNVDQYIHDYDVVVNKMIEAVGGPKHAPKFMGIGGAPSGWVAPFLDRSKHVANSPPIDYISSHWYCNWGGNNDLATYETFFSTAKGYVSSMKSIIAQRNASSFPQARIDLNELGVLRWPTDNNPGQGIDAGLPGIYWNAAGAMYAYLFASFAPLGIETLGQSQLAGSPEIPEWGIPLPQFPSVSMIDWRTGLGNARYWVLKLLIEEFAAGDSIVETEVAPAVQPNQTCSPTFCGTDSGPDYDSVSLTCCGGTSETITAIDFADWGTPSGSCGSYKHGQCNGSAADVTAWVASQCLGKHGCTLAPVPSSLGDPCFGVLKKLVVQARCSGNQGGYAKDAGKEPAPAVVALGFVSSRTVTKKLLVINTRKEAQLVDLSDIGAVSHIRAVDPEAVQEASANGIRNVELAASQRLLELKPFAVAVIHIADEVAIERRAYFI